MPDRETVFMEGVTIIFRNFKGEEKKYNKEGDRNFGVLLDEETAEKMAADGWNVKWLEPREDADPEEVRQPFLPVSLRYDVGRPPVVALINAKGRRNLDEHEVSDLDYVDIVNVDMGVRPYPWEVNGKSGVKAYLQSIYVTIEEDYLERKYSELERR